MMNDLPFFTAVGSTGAGGKDGISPTIAVETITDGHRLTIADATGSKTVDIMNGAAGTNGAEGPQGPAGKDGKDGTNATITNVSATIDNTSGNPGVAVSLGGTANERTFAFSFTGLKGSKGDQGKQGEPGQSGVYIGEEEPSNTEARVWIDTSEDANFEYDFVPTTRSIAGVPLTSDITSDTLKSKLSVPLYQKGIVDTPIWYSWEQGKEWMANSNTAASQPGYRMVGTYTLIGDMCFITATIPTPNDWRVVYYDLPKAVKEFTSFYVLSNNTQDLNMVDNHHYVLDLGWRSEPEHNEENGQFASAHNQSVLAIHRPNVSETLQEQRNLKVSFSYRWNEEI